jgi:hypothetical protein
VAVSRHSLRWSAGGSPFPDRRNLTTEVARRAEHGVAVPPKIYARRIDGPADVANQRITNTLGTAIQSDPEAGDDEGDGASRICLLASSPDASESGAGCQRGSLS